LTSRKYGLEKELGNWFSGAKRVVMAGIGNSIRMDDYVGVKIIEDLRGRVSDAVLLLECETVPESYMQQIIDFNPTHVLLIDAAVQGLKPGESILVKPEQLTSIPAFSTHMLPLRIFCEYLKKTIGAKIGLLLIEPKKTDFGEGLSPEINNSAKKITHDLLEILHQTRRDAKSKVKSKI
jgi:hydrogenase 3 maturation protease